MTREESQTHVDAPGRWYEAALRWGGVSFAVVALIPILGLMPPMPDGPAWWKSEAGLVNVFVATYLFAAGVVGFVGAVQYERKRVYRSPRARRNIMYLLIALNFFAGTLYYLCFAAWRQDDQPQARDGLRN